MKYIWQNKNWPNFEYNLESAQEHLYLYAKVSSEIVGSFQLIEEDQQQEAQLDIVISEAIRTSEIEGEFFTKDDIRSSLKNCLSLSEKREKVRDKGASAISELMVSSRESFNDELSEEMLFYWHHTLMQFSSDRDKINIGRWRDSIEPMQIISGPFGREKVHYEAPDSDSVPDEINKMIYWFNATKPGKDSIVIPGPVRAAIAHLYFEVIHPFDDGNGRIGRAISEKALAQDLGRPILLSLSTEILKNKKAYYDELSIASKSGLDITRWVNYFCKLCYKAQISTKELIDFIVFKSRFWRENSYLLNDRQEKALSRMFKEGPEGFLGGMTTRKYMIITDTSKATATRDLTDLNKKGCLRKLPGEGRSTSYELPWKTINS